MIKYIKILQKYYLDYQINNILKSWDNPNRYWHNLNHLLFILKKIDEIKSLSIEEYEILIIAAFFHDVVYNPRERNNETESINLFKQYSSKLPDNYYNIIIKIIECTAMYPKIPKGKLSILFWKMDNDPVINKDFYGFIDYENKIRKEYSFIDTPTYKENRIKFLQKYIGLVDKSVDEFIKECVNYVSNLY